MSARPTPDELSRTAVQVRVIADNVDRSRAEVGSLAEPFLGTDREDVVALLHEAERQLHVAQRALQRAITAFE